MGYPSFIVVTFPNWVCAKPLFSRMLFYRVRQGALGDEFMEPGEQQRSEKV
jgi:hypothetical protein